MSRTFKRLKLALCEGRHEIPEAVDGSIYPQVLNPTDFVGMDAIADFALHDAHAVDLYITGLTAAVLAVVKYCEAHEITLNAYHYDRESGQYRRQSVLYYDRCPFCGERIHGEWECPNCGAT